MSTAAKWGITLTGVTTAVLGTVLAVKSYRTHQTTKALNAIEQKFLKLQDNVPEVQKTFKDVFLRNDITEKETLEMLNRYKEIEKLGITGTKEEYPKALFNEANKNYGIKLVELIIENFEKKTVGGSANHLDNCIKINPNTKKETLVDVVHHELRHVKQSTLVYNYSPETYRQHCVSVSIFDFDQNLKRSVDKYVDELIGSRLVGPVVQQKVAEKFKVEIDALLRKKIGIPSVDKVPKVQIPLVEKLVE